MYAQRDYTRGRGSSRGASRGSSRGRGRGASRGGRGGRSNYETQERTDRTDMTERTEKPKTLETICTPELQKHNYPAYVITMKNKEMNKEINKILEDYFENKSDYKFRVIQQDEEKTISILVTKTSLMEKFELKIAEKNTDDFKITTLNLDSSSFPTRFNSHFILKVMRPMELSPHHCINIIKSLIQFFEDCGILTDEVIATSKKDRSPGYITTSDVTIAPYVNTKGEFTGNDNFAIINFNKDVKVSAIAIFKLFCNAQIWFNIEGYKISQMKTFWM